MSAAVKQNPIRAVGKPGRRARQMLAQDSIRAAVARGDVEALCRVARSGTAVQRREAVAALGWVGNDACVETLMAALADAGGGVSRAARKVLERRFVVSRERLWDVFVNGRSDRVRVQVVRLMSRGERAQSMVSLLLASALADGRVREAAVRGLREWGHDWPGTSLVATFNLAAALFVAEGTLPDDLAASLWAYVTPLTGLHRPRGSQLRPREPADRAAAASWLVSDATPAPAPALGARIVRWRYELAPKPFAWVRAMWRR